MAAVTLDTNQARAMRVAVKRIEGFAKQFGEAHRNLARHVAFPLVLTPDLLYQIWANFVPEAPWTAVAHVLLSRLCRQVGYEMYEMDIADRNLLLRELKEQFGQKRLDELGEFLLDYVAQQLTGDDLDTQDLAEAQEWTALAYTKPDEVVRQLAQALSKNVEHENMGEVLRLASLVETLAEPLVEEGFEPLLIYSRGMANLARGKQESATTAITSLLVDKEARLKIAGVNLPIPEPIASFTQELSTNQSSSQSSKNYHILVVDDSPDNLFLVQTILEEEGYEVSLAEDGEIALSEIEASPPDLVLLDVMMPGMDGFEVTSRIRHNHDIPFIPILLITASNQPSVVKGLDSGANDFIRRPFETDELLARVRSLLRLKDLISESVASFNQELSTNQSSSQSSKNYRILLVDDSPDNLFLVQTILEEEGYEVSLVEDGARALSEIEVSPPDLVLLDVMMPGMDGFEVTRQLRNNPDIPFIPILLVTASNQPSVVKGLDSGANDFIRKPIELDELLARVRSLLRLKDFFQRKNERTGQL